MASKTLDRLAFTAVAPFRSQIQIGVPSNHDPLQQLLAPGEIFPECPSANPNPFSL